MLDKKSHSHSCGQLAHGRSSSVSAELISQLREALVQSSLSSSSGQQLLKVHTWAEGVVGGTKGYVCSAFILSQKMLHELVFQVWNV